jgi:hypothetical protein
VSEFLVIFVAAVVGVIGMAAVAMYAGKKTIDHIFEHASGEFTKVSICGTCGDIDGSITLINGYCRRCGGRDKSEAIAQYKKGAWRNQAGFPISRGTTQQ